MTQTHSLLIGNKLICDPLNPRPEDIDLDGIEASLWQMKRFSSNPDALTVRQHTRLVARLAQIDNQTPAVVRWCHYHDDHEGIITDIPGPLKRLIGQHTDVLDRIEARLDVAICAARGIPTPDRETRAIVHYYDKLAETLEWRFRLQRDRAPWNVALPRWMGGTYAAELVAHAFRSEKGADA